MKMANSGDLSTHSSDYDLEYRSTADDAWYTVRVILEDDKLTVKLWSFPDACDERFIAGDFATPEAVDEFCERFRLVSEQLQDSQCSRIIEGMMVCASVASKDKNDVRYYDAVVEAVHYKDHLFVRKEEECLCTFVLFWQHGPKAGDLTSCNIEDMCLIQYGAQVDPRLASFSKLAKEKIYVASLKSSSVLKGDLSLCKRPTCYKENRCSIKPKSSLSEQSFQEMETAREFVGPIRTSDVRVGKCYQQSDHDKDMGGGSFDMHSVEETSSHHFIIIENLEKDLSPLSIMEFIHKQTCVSAQVYVFPSLSSESYTRGAIVLDCKVKLKKIYDFLSNPDHVIMSSKGRPWVITEKILRRGNFRTTLGSLMPKSQDELQCQNIDNVVKIVHSGTEEYWTANRLKDLFMDFFYHQRRLHKRLALEERKQLQPTNAFTSLACCK